MSDLSSLSKVCPLVVPVRVTKVPALSSTTLQSSDTWEGQEGTGDETSGSPSVGFLLSLPRSELKRVFEPPDREIIRVHP